MRQTELHLSDEDRVVIDEIRVELAVFDVARSGRPARYDTDAEARVTALACSAPPEGRQRWTKVALERAARQEPGLGSVSRETVRRMLKKPCLSG
jgi:hypothetical protein